MKRIVNPIGLGLALCAISILSPAQTATEPRSTTDEIRELRGCQAAAAVERDGQPFLGHDGRHPFRVQSRLRVIHAVGVADGRGEAVDAREADEIERDLECLCLARLVAADAVLDAPDGLDLAFDSGTDGMCLGDDLSARGPVVRDTHPGAIE